MNQSLAIIILNWNGVQWLEKFLPAVIAHSQVPHATIYVCDNASTDDSVDFVKQNFPSISIIKNTENNGYAGGYNFAISSVREDIICLLNSDIEVTENWLNPILNAFEKNSKMSACQPKILSFNEKNKFEYAGAAGGYMDILGYPFSKGRIFDTTEEDKGQYNEESLLFWASGACLFVRRNVYMELGGLDEDFFAHQEEIDLCWRMQLAGHSILAIPSSVVYHVGGGSLPYGNARKTYLNFRNNLVMLIKNSSLWTLLWLFPIRLILDGIAALVSVLKTKKTEDLGAILRAHFYIYSNMFSILKKRSVINNIELRGVYKGSIVFDYQVLKKRLFSEIVK
jgi:GT2 family glycosyltransferase